MTNPNPYQQPSDPAKRRSAVMTDGPDRAPARAMLKAIGFDNDALAKPIVASPPRGSRPCRATSTSAISRST